MGTSVGARALVAALVVIGLAGPARAEFEHRRGEGLRQSVLWWQENDWLFSDRGYTNGFALNWMSPELTTADSPLLETSLWALNRGLRIFGTRVDRGQMGLTVGQLMFTPGRFWSTTIRRDDQPFAGWSFTGVVARLAGTEDTFTLSGRFGPLGPLAYAGQTQTFIHTWIVPNAPQPGGWGNQTADGVGLQADLEWAHTFLAVDGAHWRYLDVRSRVGARLGTVVTAASLGVETRLGLLGRHLYPGHLDPRFFEALLGPGWASTVADAATRDLLLYVHFGIQPRLVAHHALIAGTLFANNTHTVDPSVAVLSVDGGFTAQLWIFHADLGLFMNTPEAQVRRDRGQIHWKLDVGFVF